MDIDHSDITEKIRNSIKEKLKDLNLFVDDELPDYIMILVANKRSKHHMEKDLSLFLGNETSEFTNWLWDLVNNLKVGSKIKHLKQKQQDSRSTSADAPEFKENTAEEDDVLNYDPTEEGEFLRKEITGDSSSSQLREINHVNSASKVVSEIKNDSKTDVLSSSKALIPDQVAVKEIPNSMEVEDTKKLDDIIESSAVRKSVQKSAKVYPVQRAEEVPTSSSETRKSDYAGNVSSVVRITQRKYNGTFALQANKLLLKAVNDAAKSVLDGKDISEYFKPTPVNVLPSNVTGTFNAKEENCNTKMIQVINFEADKDSRTVKSSNQLKMNIEADNCKSKVVEAHSLQHKQVIRLNADTTVLDVMSENSNTSSPMDQGSTSLSDSEHQITPHFIVTLDGGNSSSLKRKRSSVELMEVDTSFAESLDFVSTKKQKLQKRCKYWPACKNSDYCLFHHPTVPCKSFPKCKFGDKCLFVHPKCKFGSLCSRENCSYTHCSKRKVPVKIPASIKPAVQHAKLVCKYNPKCTDKSCRFIHPKLCLFGVYCRNPKCTFRHFQVPHRSLLKWKAH